MALFAERGIAVAEFDSLLDTQFAASEETHREGVRFLRVDADLSVLEKESEQDENKALSALFLKVSKNEKLTVKQEVFEGSEIPAILKVTEESRRMEDMMKMYRMANEDGDAPAFPLDMTLVLNTDAPLIKKLLSMQASGSEKCELLATEIYRLSLLSHRKLTKDEMQAFLTDSYKLLLEVSE